MEPRTIILLILFSFFCQPLLHAQETAEQNGVDQVDQLLAEGKQKADKFEFKESILSLERAVQLSPHNTKAIGALAKVYALDGRYLKAISYYEGLLEIEPANVDALVEAATIYERLGHFSHAEALMERAHELAPDRTDVTVKYNMSREWVDQLDNRITRLQREVALDQNDVASYVALGRTYIWMDDLDAALKTYEDALRHKPNDPVILYNIGYIYEQVGDWIRAKSYYLGAVKIKPDYLEAKLALEDLKLLYHPQMTTRYHIYRFSRYDPWLGFTGAIERDDQISVEYIQPIHPNLEIKGGYQFTLTREINRITSVREYMMYVNNPYIQFNSILPFDINALGKYDYYSYSNAKLSNYSVLKRQVRHGGFFILSKNFWTGIIANNASFEFNRTFYTEYYQGFVSIEASNNYSFSDDLMIGRYFSSLFAYNMNYSSTRNGMNRDYTLRPRLRLPFYEPISIEYMFNFAEKPNRYTHMANITFETSLFEWLDLEVGYEITYFTLDSALQQAGLFTINVFPLDRLYFTVNGMFGYFNKNLTHDYIVSANIIF